MNYAVPHRTKLHAPANERIVALKHILPLGLEQAERIALYLFLSILWGVLLYLALMAA